MELKAEFNFLVMLSGSSLENLMRKTACVGQEICLTRSGATIIPERLLVSSGIMTFKVPFLTINFMASADKHGLTSHTMESIKRGRETERRLYTSTMEKSSTRNGNMGNRYSRRR